MLIGVRGSFGGGGTDKALGPRSWARRRLWWTAGLAIVLISLSIGAMAYGTEPYGRYPEVVGGLDLGRLLAKNTRVERATGRPYLGITYQDMGTRATAHPDITPLVGAVVISVAPGSPAAMGGVRVGDVVLAVNNQALGQDSPLLKILLQHTPGDRVKLMAQRGPEHLTMEIVLGRQ